jgi:outer membrane receptor for ferrienterochelin and colicin
MKNYILYILLILTTIISGKNASIKGVVTDAYSNEPIDAATVVIPSLNKGTITDENGNYVIEDIESGEYNVLVSFLGYETKIEYEVRLIAHKTVYLDFQLEKSEFEIEEVVVKAKPVTRTAESPVSLKSISATEIYRNPGGNRDISRVLQGLPGVGTVASFRNDIFVRGGAPSENRFFLDGIEVPNINHFATQGSSGGPVGMINVDFIREVNFFSGAFPSNRGNSLSSVIEFKQKEGNPDNINTSITVGSSDYGLTFEGPSGEKSNFIFSARRSYLQFLFKALGLPFLPTYNDFQYKHSFKIDRKNKLTIIGLGAIDEFELNKDVNEGEKDEEKIERNKYLINSLPINEQWNYTIGAKWQHFGDNAFQTYVLSRNHLNNTAKKYYNNIETPENKKLLYESEEIEHKFRFENNLRTKNFKLNFGAGIEHAQYKTDIFNKRVLGGNVVENEFDTDLNLFKFSIFANTSKKFFSNKLEASVGIRTDFSSYSSDMSNPIDQISPRISLSYQLTDDWSLNANTGIYYQLPAYTVLGFRNQENELQNKENGIKYIQSIHYVLGSEYNFNDYFNISVEGFYKDYNDYPFLIDEKISLANLGADFGVIGNENINSNSEGRAYGLEFIAQQRLSSSVYGILSYTLVRSEFKNGENEYAPSSWDNKHILNITAGKKFEGDWEVGVKFRLAGGAPYTPYDYELSGKKEIWDANQQPVWNYSKINTERLDYSHGMDIRIDKKWYIKDVSIGVYLDIQNVYNKEIEGVSNLIAELDENEKPIEDPDKPGFYKMKEIKTYTGTLLPSIGLIIEF